MPLKSIQCIAVVVILARYACAASLTNLATPSTITITAGATTSSLPSTLTPPSTVTSISTASTTATFLTSSATAVTSTPGLSTTSISHLPSPGIPTLTIPYTADAPFMQKSNLPEGTVFIAVGAVLAALGVCVLLWRGLVAWSINYSVKKQTLASLRGSGGSEKDRSKRHWRASTYRPVSTKQPELYKDDYGSSITLDALTSSGKPTKPHFREPVIERSTTPPQNLFFSPTAQSHHRRNSSYSSRHRTSAYVPAGYHPSPPAAQASGGAENTTPDVGQRNPISPYSRNSYAHAHRTSPPSSPSTRPTTRGSAQHNVSQDQTRNSAYEGPFGARNIHYEPAPRYAVPPPSYAQPSSSSLMVGAESVEYESSRAPSTYMDDMFDDLYRGPRDRF